MSLSPDKQQQAQERRIIVFDARENFELATPAAAAHSGSKWLKPAENKFIQSALTSFSMQISANLHNFCFREPAKGW